VEKSLNELSPSARRVQDAIISAGLECRVVELPASTRTAQEAADAIGCTVSQIVKSLVFRGRQSGKGIFVAASGSNRVNEKRLKEYTGEGIEKASPEFVREITGFAIGGVAPIAHLQPLESYIDRDLLGYSELWAAAGTPNAVFRLTPGDLTQLSSGRVVDIT
jgi:prolyl-tRNA editing enzyme YbaK/EbsC (Cys-tRNA(Pro) deacylase)